MGKNYKLRCPCSDSTFKLEQFPPTIQRCLRHAASRRRIFCFAKRRTVHSWRLCWCSLACVYSRQLVRTSLISCSQPFSSWLGSQSPPCKNLQDSYPQTVPPYWSTTNQVGLKCVLEQSSWRCKENAMKLEIMSSEVIHYFWNRGCEMFSHPLLPNLIEWSQEIPRWWLSLI